MNRIKKSLMSFVVAFVALLVLSGCSSEANRIMDSAQTTKEYATETSNHFNAIKDSESQLQALFEESLEQDEELTNFANKEVPVFDNIDQRQDSLNELEDATQRLNRIKNKWSRTQQETIDEAVYQDMIADIDSAVTGLSTYIEAYNEYLDQQEDYFVSIGDEEANYESFAQGIASLEDLDQQLYEIEIQLNPKLSDLHQTANLAFSQALTAADEESR